MAKDTIMLDPDHLRGFAEHGFIVLPGLVPPDLLAAAHRRIDAVMAEAPPPEGHRGFHFTWGSGLPEADPLMAALLGGGAFDAASALVRPLALERPDAVQVSLNIPVWPHRPGGPHIDGLSPVPADGQPASFTLLVGLFLTDQTEPDMGNLWVWPGSHRVIAAHLREHGAEALLGMAHPTLAVPDLTLAAPEQVTGRSGDVLLAHYLLGHNMGGNTSDTTRRTLYWRLRAEGHRARWRECMTEPMMEFEAVRRA